MNGNKVIGTFSISRGVSHSVDNEISLPRPESWRKSVFREAISLGNEGITGVRDSKIQHTAGSYTYGDGDTAEVCGECSGGEDKRDDE